MSEFLGADKNSEQIPYAEILDQREMQHLGFEIWRLTNGDCTYESDAVPDPDFMTVPPLPTPETPVRVEPTSRQWERYNGFWRLKRD